MKKFISLVLALVMALSLTTIAWGATTTLLPSDDFKGAVDAAGANDIIDLDGGTFDVSATINITKSITITGGTLKRAAAFGHLFNVSGTDVVLTLDGVTIDGNGGAVTASGAAIHVQGGASVDVKNSTITNHNSTYFAAAIYTPDTANAIGGVAKNVSLTNSTVSNNTGIYDGPVFVRDLSGTFTFDATSKVINNTASGEAGGIQIHNTNATIAGTISGNKALKTDGNGGGLYTFLAANKTITIESTAVITGNTAGGAGGGLYVNSDKTQSLGKVVMNGGTISGNTAKDIDPASTTLKDMGGDDLYVARGVMEINGGTIGTSGTANEIIVSNAGVTNGGNAGKLTINGGNVNGKIVTPADATSSKVAITGGTFDTDVSEYVAAGYRLVNGTVASVPANTTGVVGGYEGMFTTAGATRQAVTNLTKTPAVAPLDVDEDGYYNRAGDRLGSIEYYTLNLGGAVAQNYYKVNTVDDADLIIYVGDSKTPYMYLANEPAGGFTYLTGAAAFNNFGKACGQFKWAAVDTTKTYYAYDGKVYVANPAGAVNLMIGTSFIQATDVTANGSWVAHSPVYTQDKTGAVTAVKCANCPASAVIVANYAALPNTVKAAGTYFNVPGSASKMFYWVDGVVVDTETKVESAETFDAGIAMYVGMSVMAAAGSAVVLKKKD